MFALSLSPFAGSAHAAATQPATRTLAFHQLHTGERLTASYWSDGRYDQAALDEIDWLLRDFRNDQRMSIDRKLLDTLFGLRQLLDVNEPFLVISAYRSPATNTKLRALGRGVAKRSLHMRGMAIDIRVPRRELKDVRRAALTLRAGGVGYYPKSNFVHVDTGRVRFW